jgi:hypothetical protein
MKCIFLYVEAPLLKKGGNILKISWSFKGTEQIGIGHSQW